MPEKVVLAYSGGLDTSVAIKWLKEKYNLDVIASLLMLAMNVTSLPCETRRLKLAQ